MADANGRPSIPPIASIVIVGAGYTGRRVLERLPPNLAAGLNRSGHPRDLPLAQLDLDTDDALPVTPSDDYSLLYTVPPMHGDVSDTRLQRLLALLPHSPGRITYLSTTGVYGDRGGQLVDESSTPTPESDRARRRVAAEQILSDWCGQAGSELVILRVPGIYGPGRLGIDSIRKGMPVLAEDDANPGNRIHVDDLVACCMAALSTDTPPGIYNVGDGDTRSSTWFTMEVARQLGLESPPTVSRETAEKTFSAGRLSFLRESRRVDLARMREVLKPHLTYLDAAAGIAASLSDSE